MVVRTVAPGTQLLSRRRLASTALRKAFNDDGEAADAIVEPSMLGTIAEYLWFSYIGFLLLVGS